MEIQVALISPVNNLELTEEGDFGFVLAHLCNNEKYVEYFKNYKGRKIIDNSAAEGARVKTAELLDAAKRVGANCVICPDEIMNRESTKSMTETMIMSMSKTELKTYELLAVPHGRSTTEYVDSARELAEIPEIKWLGISKFDSSEVWGKGNIARGRFWAVNELIMRGVTKNMHLLGRGSSKELFWHVDKKNTCVKSSDSAVEILNAIENFTPDDVKERIVPRHDYFDMTLSPEVIERAKRNFNETKQYARGIDVKLNKGD